MILNCNERPPLDANRKDLWSKIYLLEFPVTFVDNEYEIISNLFKVKDNNLKEKMKTWNVSMMNILLEYLHYYKSEGLEYTENIKSSILQEKQENDPVGEYISQYIVKSESFNLKISDVLDDYIIKNNLRLSSKERGKLKSQFFSKIGEGKKINGFHYWVNMSFI